MLLQNKKDGQYRHKQRRYDKPRPMCEFPDKRNFRYKILMHGLIHQISEQDKQSRHQQKH